MMNNCAESTILPNLIVLYFFIMYTDMKMPQVHEVILAIVPRLTKRGVPPLMDVLALNQS